ncbi:hypothetical protein Tco_0670049 [Tanacetum coccineum]
MEQAEKQKTPKFTIKSTDKAALQEYDQKSALYQIMHANKSFNRNLANHRLYHALMEALIEDENAMDKGVANTVQDHKRKHDDDEDDDEDPPARPNQGKQTKRRRTNDSESSKNPSITKETPKGKAPSKGFKTGKSAPTKEPVKEPIVEVVMDDAGNDMVYNEDQPQDASEPKTTKTPNPDRFIQPPRPPTLALEWIKRQVILDQPKQLWFNKMVSATKDPLTFNDLMATPIDFSKYVLNGLKTENLTQDILLGPASNLLKGTCSSKGDRYPFDLSKPLPLQGPTGHRTITVDSFFNNDLEYLKTSDPEIVVKRSDQQLYKFKEGDFVDLHLNDIEDMLLLAVQHKLFHLEGSDIVDFIVALQIEFKEPYTPSYDPPGIVYEDLNKQKRVLRADELYKLSHGTLKSVRDEIHHRVLEFRLDYNTEMPKRKWMAVDRKRSGLMIELINKQLREREIIKNLE